MIGGEALFAEIDKNPRAERKQENTALLAHAIETIRVSAPIANRARELQTAGYGAFDALHLACSEPLRVLSQISEAEAGMVKEALGLSC